MLRITLLFIYFSFLHVKSFSQNAAPPPPPPIKQDSSKANSFATTMPQFPGGIPALMTYLKDNINYPKRERRKGIQGKVILTFIVDKDGNIIQPKVVQGIKGGENLEKEALRVVSAMPKWEPGTMDGKKVNVQYNLPVNFKLK
ncbi:MAG TPA: energy transducer TonB [Bacteroidia bacterium]|jgi:TonB family protein|nr:energy transducer TonB [Bacteroidia bacterium]